MSRAARSTVEAVAGDLAFSTEFNGPSLPESTRASLMGNSSQRSASASREVLRRLLQSFEVYAQTLLQTARLCATSAASAPVGKQPSSMALMTLAFGLVARLASLAPERFCAPVSTSPQASATSSSAELTSLVSLRTGSSIASETLRLLLALQHEAKLPIGMCLP